MHYLQPGGRLAEEMPNAAGPSSSFYYDPADPTPTVGGRLLTVDAGVKDNRALEARPDVLTFTTAPLTSDLEITGVPAVELFHSRDNQFADLFVRLCDVDPEGGSRNFSDAYLRLDPASAGTEASAGARRLELRLDACAHRLPAGHRLRLQVSGGSHPRYDRSEGTGAPPGTGTELLPCIHTVWHAPGAASRIVLPVARCAGRSGGSVPGLLEELAVVAVALALEVVAVDEAQRRRVDAVAQAAAVARAVVEHVAQVAVAVRGAHLGAEQPCVESRNSST